MTVPITSYSYISRSSKKLSRGVRQNAAGAREEGRYTRSHERATHYQVLLIYIYIYYCFVYIIIIHSYSCIICHIYIEWRLLYCLQNTFRSILVLIGVVIRSICFYLKLFLTIHDSDIAHLALHRARSRKYPLLRLIPECEARHLTIWTISTAGPGR